MSRTNRLFENRFFVTPVPAFAGVNLSPRRRGAGVRIFLKTLDSRWSLSLTLMGGRNDRKRPLRHRRHYSIVPSLFGALLYCARASQAESLEAKNKSDK